MLTLHHDWKMIPTHWVLLEIAIIVLYYNVVTTYSVLTIESTITRNYSVEEKLASVDNLWMNGIEPEERWMMGERTV
jgi:hypothetical protein